MQFLKQFLFFLVIISIISFIDSYYLGAGITGIDDGNIFLNYAHHLAHGDGFVFNTNGEHVEGFTSFLWVIICAGAYLVTANPELLLICFSLLLTTLVFTNIYRAIYKDVAILYPSFSKYFFWLYTAFIITIGPSFIAWSVLSLMENALWNFTFSLLLILVLSTVEAGTISFKRKSALIISGCLLSLIRPEALAWNLVFTVILAYTFIQNRRKLFFPLLYFVSFAVIEICLTLFRLHYFGYRFPNTYYAKISPDRLYNLTEGAKYALSFITGYQPVISFLFVLMTIVLLYAVFKLKILFKQKDDTLANSSIVKKFAIVTGIIWIGFLLPCTTGGDHFGGFRFYQHLLPLFAWGIVVMLWLYKYYRNSNRNISAIGFATVIIFLLVIALNNLAELKSPAKTQMNFEFLLARQDRELAAHLNKTFSIKPSVGKIAIGGFGLIYEGETVDLMGLNNIAMGHSPGDRKGIKNHAAFNKDIFYTLKPDVLLPQAVTDLNEAHIVYFGLIDANNFDNQAMKNIFNDAAFQKLYLPVYLYDIKNNTGYFLFAGIDFIDRLKNNADYKISIINS